MLLTSAPVGSGGGASKTQGQPQATTRDASHQFVGIVERPPGDFQHRAIEQWTAELKDLLSKGESEFVNLFQQRIALLANQHNNAQGAQLRKRRHKGRAMTKPFSNEWEVPAILRLGVLTMFPLIEALSTIPGANYEKLCAQTLDYIIKTIATLPPIALAKEPSDCLEAFRNFISNQIEANQHSIDSHQKAQALVALLSLVLSQARAQNVFLLLDVLFKVHNTATTGEKTLPVASAIRHVVDHARSLDVPLPLELVDDPWSVDMTGMSSKSAQHSSVNRGNPQNAGFSFVIESLSSSSLACDGKFLFIHSSRGLVKIGTGLHNTVRGYHYAVNESFRNSDKWSSLVFLGDKLYFWSPDLSYETYRPNKNDPKPADSSAASGGANSSDANVQGGNTGSSANPNAAPLPRVCHVISVLCPESLQTLYSLRVEDSSLSLQSRMITDGKYLMFVGRQRGKGKSSQTSQNSQLGIQPSPLSNQFIMHLASQQQQQQPNQQQLQQGALAQLLGNNYQSNGGNASFGQASFQTYASFGNEPIPQLGGGGFSFNNNQPLNVHLNQPQFRPASPLQWGGAASFPVRESSNDPVAVSNESAWEQENPSDEGSVSSEEDDDEDEDDEDAENDNENDNDSEEGEGSEEPVDEDLYDEVGRDVSPQRRSTSSRSAPGGVRASSRQRVKEEDDMVSSVMCVEWFDVHGAAPGDSLLTESMTLVPEISQLKILMPIRALELPNRAPSQPTSTFSSTSMPLATGGEELLPPSFGAIAFYTNGHQLVAISTKNATYRVFSLIDGKPLPELTAAHTTAQRPPDGTDSFVFDPRSNSIWTYRTDSQYCSRYHNMGTTPYYPGTEGPNAMMVDSLSASTNSKSPESYSFPQMPPFSPEVILNGLDVWGGPPQKTRLVGLPKPPSVIVDRTLKDNLSPLDCILVLTASLDRLARHHWAYNSAAVVDDTCEASYADFHFTVDPSVETLQLLLANIEHSLALIAAASATPGPTCEPAGALVLSFLRLLKVNLHFFNATGKSTSIKDEQRKLFDDIRTLLINLSATPGVSKPTVDLAVALQNQRLHSLICSEACEAICTGYFSLFPQTKLQIEFLKSLAEIAIQQPTLLYEKLVASLASYYRVQELLLDDGKGSMDVDQPESAKSKRGVSMSANNISSLNQSKDRFLAEMRRELPFHNQTPSLLSLLVRKALTNTFSELERVDACSTVTELNKTRLGDQSVSATLRLLLSLQMEIVTLAYSKSLVVVYFELVAKIVEEFLNQVAGKFTLDEPVASSEAQGGDYLLKLAKFKASHKILECSILGALLPPLLQGLARKHVKDPQFVITAFDKLCHLLECVDRFNIRLDAVRRVDLLHLVNNAKQNTSKASSNTANASMSSNATEKTVSYLLDLQSSLALVARRCVVTLLEGEPVSDKEKQCQDWLDTRLINGGLDENPQNLEKLRWLESFAEGKTAPGLYTWIKSQGGSRPQARPTAKAQLERAERYALAAMMKHAGLTDDAQTFAKALEDHTPLSSAHVGRFSFIAKKSAAFASILTRRAEMQKAWQLAVQDKVNDFDVFREMVTRSDRLYDFCEMQGVEANPVNTEETIKRLMQKLQEEITVADTLKKSGNQPASDIFEALCAPVVERASFLLKLLPSNRTVKPPAADSSNPYSKRNAEMQRLRASAPGSKEGAGRGYLTKSMSLLPATESAQEKIRQRESEQQDSQSFSQRVGELRSWLQAYSEWEQTVLQHNRPKRDEPPPTSPIQGVIAFTTNQSITVKDWERVLRVQALRAKSREQGLIYLKKLIFTCHFIVPRQQLLGPLAVSHYLDGIQSSGQALTTRVTELFGELFLAYADILRDTTLDSSSRLLALNVCAISYTEHDAALLEKADIFQLLHEIMSETAPANHELGSEAVEALKSLHQALHDAAWTCFRLFAAQVVTWRHYDDMHVDRSVLSKLQQQSFDVFLNQLRLFSETLVSYDLNEWQREILVIDPQAGHEFAYELAFLMRLLSETSRSWSSNDAVPTLLKFLSSRTAPRAQRVVLRLLRKLLPSSLGNKQLIQFCLGEMGKWIFQGKCYAANKPVSPQPKSQDSATKLSPNAPPATSQTSDDATGSEGDAPTSMSILNSTSDALEQMLSSGTLAAPMIDLIKQAHAPDPSAPWRTQIASVVGRNSSTTTSHSKPLPYQDAIQLATLRAKYGDIVQLHSGKNSISDFSSGARGKNEVLTSLNPVYWANGGAASMLASEYIALLRYLCDPAHPTWLLAVRDMITSSINSLPTLLGKLSSDPEKLEQPDSDALFLALSALCLLAGAPESIRVGCKVVINAPVVSQAEQVTGTVVSYSSSTSFANVILDSEAQDQQTVHSFDTKQLRAIPEIDFDVKYVASVASKLIPSLLAVATTSSPLDTVPALSTLSETKHEEKSLHHSSMDVDAHSPSSATASASTPEIPLHHYQNVWLYQELKAKTLCALDLLLQHPEGAQYMVKHCSDSIPSLLQLAQKADSTTYMEKIERELTSIAARLWDIQTIPSDLQGRSRRNTQSDMRGMSDVLPYFWNAGKSAALPTGLDKTSLAPGSVLLDEDARSVQLQALRNAGHHGGNFGRPGRGGLNRLGGSHKGDHNEVVFMFGNCLIPSKGLGQYYFELYIHPDSTVERQSGAPSKPLVSIGLVPDPQGSGPATASTTSSSSYRQSYRGGHDLSMPFPPGSYCYLSTRHRAWVVDGNLRTDGYGEHFGYGSVVGCLWDQVERTITFTKDGEELDVAFRNVLAVGDQKSGNPERLVPCVSSSRGVQLTLNFGQEPFKFTPVTDDTLDLAAREAKRKEAEEKRQKAIQEEQAKRKAEQEQREAIFNEDASVLLSMGFCPRHCLRAMMHAGWTYKNRWLSQEGVMMAANWLMEASPDQLGPAGDLPSESAAPAPAEEPPRQPISSSSSSSGSKKKPSKSEKSSIATPATPSKPAPFQKPVNPENDYPTSKSSEFVLGDSYSLGAPRRAGVTQASIWRRDILPLITSDIPFPANDPTVNQLIAYAEAGNEDALKSNLADLYHGKIPGHIRLPSQMKIVETEPTQLKMTQIMPDMYVNIASADSNSHLASFVGKSGKVLDRDLKRNLVLIQFVSSEDGTLEEWWFHVTQLSKDRSPTPEFAEIRDAPSLHVLLAARTQQYSFFAARRVLLSLLHQADLGFDVARAKRELEELVRAAAKMEVDATEDTTAEATSSSSPPAAHAVPGAIDVQDAVQLISREFLTSPETLVSSNALFTNSKFDDGINFAGLKLVELLSRVHKLQGLEACEHLLNAMMQKCIGLFDLASHFSNSKTYSFSHHDSLASSTQQSTNKSSGSGSGKGSSGSGTKETSDSSVAPVEGVISMPNNLHKVHIPGARACIVLIHAETDRSTRLNVYLDEELNDMVPSIGGLSDLESSSSSVPFASGGPFQPVLVPTNTFWVKARVSTQGVANIFGGDFGRSNLEYRVSVVPVSSDVALARWIAEFLTFSTTTGDLRVPLDFNPLLDTLIDFLYVTQTPSILKESVMALLTRIIHELRRRARGQNHKLCQLVDPVYQTLDLSRLNMLKKEMLALYDNERRSASNSDNGAVKKRGSLFTTYLQSLVELMIAVRLYDIEKTARQKLLSEMVPQSFNEQGVPDETMKTAMVLAKSMSVESGVNSKYDEVGLVSALSLFGEDEDDSAPRKSSVPAEGSEDSSTTSSDLSVSNESDREASRIMELFGEPPSPAPAAGDNAAEPSMGAKRSGASSPSASMSGQEKPDTSADASADADGELFQADSDALLQPELNLDLSDDPGWLGGYGDMGDMMGNGDMDDDLAAAIALSMREQLEEEAKKEGTKHEEEGVEEADGKKDEEAEKPKPDQKAEESSDAKKDSEEMKKATDAQNSEEKKDVTPTKDSGSPKSQSPAVPSSPSPAAMSVDGAPSAPPPPPLPSFAKSMASLMSVLGSGNASPKTPSHNNANSSASSRSNILGGAGGAPRKPTTTPSVPDPSWFATLIAAAQALENFAEQADTGKIPPTCTEACTSSQADSSSMHLDTTPHSAATSAKANATTNAKRQHASHQPHVDPIALQFTKDSIRTAWNNTKSQDFVRHRLYLLDHLPVVDMDKRAELATAIEEIVEEKALVVDGSMYLPVDYQTRKTKPWMIVEVQSTDVMPSNFTFKDPNFTGNKSVKIEAVPIRRLLERCASNRPSTPSTPGPTTTTTTTTTTTAAATNSANIASNGTSTSTPISAATAVVASTASNNTEEGTKDLHYDEPDASLEPSYAHLDERWREYVRSRMWDKRSQTLTREFREALTETFLRFCTDHTHRGVIGRKQLNQLQEAIGGEPFTEEGYTYVFSFATKEQTYAPRDPPHPGKSVFLSAHSHSGTSSESVTTSSSSAMDVDSNGKSKQDTATITETGLTLDGFLTLYTNQALQCPMYTLEEMASLGFDLHMNRTTFKTLEEAERALIGNDCLSPKSDLELMRYMEQMMTETDVSTPLQLNISHIKTISMESHLAQLYPRLVRLSTPLLCLRYEMLRQFNQKVNEVFALVNMGSQGALATWLAKCRGLIFHSLKMNFVYSILERTADDSTPCPSIMLNRIDISANKDHVMATRTEDAFTKKTAFGQAFTQLQSVDPVSFRRPKPIGAEPHFAMRVLFQKENVQGDGGPYRQFFTDIAKELAEVLPLLVPCPNAQTKIGNNRDKFVVTPSCNSSTYLKMYRFLGQLMGMAMRTGVMLAIDLPSFFWKPLVGIAPNSQDIRDIDHSFHTVLKYLKTCTPDVFEGETRTIFDHFQTTLSDKSKMLLKAGGDQLEVTYENRLEYCRLAEAARCNESCMQILEIRRGLADFVPMSLLSLFTWQDLQWRVCGRPQIDLKLLKRHTEYAEGISPTAPHIRYFWQVLRSLSQEDRRAFVRFAWAQERLPADDQEFARSQTRMMIKQGPTSDQVFPTADTCFFNLSLPVYSSPDILRERLLFAIHTDGAMDNDRPNHNDQDD